MGATVRTRCTRGVRAVQQPPHGVGESGTGAVPGRVPGPKSQPIRDLLRPPSLDAEFVVGTRRCWSRTCGSHHGLTAAQRLLPPWESDLVAGHTISAQLNHWNPGLHGGIGKREGLWHVLRGGVTKRLCEDAQGSKKGESHRRDCTDIVLTPLGAFSDSARTAPIIPLFIPGTPLKTSPLQKHA